MNRFLLLLLLLFSELLSAQGNLQGGILFNSQNGKLEERTSLNLTFEKEIQFDNNFKLNFDLSFESTPYYGNIFRIKSEELKIFLVYAPFNKDTSYIRLVVNNRSIPEKISLPKNILNRGNWFNFSLTLDRAKSEIILCMNNTPEIKSKVDLKKAESLDIKFGSIYNHERGGEDVPHIRLRNVKILGDENKLKHFWALKETGGNFAIDSISRLKAFAQNPNWLMNEHYIFKKNSQVGPFPIGNSVAAVYSEKHNKFYFVSRDFKYNYDITTGAKKKENFSVPLLHIENTIVLDDKNNKLYAYFPGQGKVSTYNEATKAWTRVDTTGERLGHYFVHNSFINPLDDQLYMINGYGWYRFHNDLQKYDFPNQKWNKIKTKGDYLVPRIGGLIYKKNESGDFYIFGGGGNVSGNQVDGSGDLFDLYLLSMKDTTITKLGEFTNLSSIPHIPPTMYVDTSKNQLFILRNAQLNSVKRFKRIFRYDIKNQTVDAVSDSLNFINDDGIPIIFIEKYKELFVFENEDIGRDSFMVNIYSLSYPFLTETQYQKLKKAEYKPSVLLKYHLWFALLALFPFAFGIYFFWSHKKTQKLVGNNAERPAGVSYEKKPVRNNSIYLFGNFQVIDKEGMDITNKFTPKLKQLFLLLLTKSYNGISRGVTTESLTSLLWPELNNEQSKNNRNVTLSKLRTILSGLDRAEISFERGVFELVLSGDVYCDFVDFKNSVDSEEYDQAFVIERIVKINNITSRGELMQECGYEWLDGIKVHFIENSILKMKEMIAKNNPDIQSKLFLANSILNLDSVNEDALSLKIKMLLELGDHKTAKNIFEQFKKEYFALYAEEYSKNFTDF